MAVMGLVLFSTMALASPYLQNVIGYPIITAGLLLATRGCGTFVADDAGRPVDAIYRGAHADHQRPQPDLPFAVLHDRLDRPDRRADIVIVSIAQGFGFGLVFVPLSTVAFLTLPNHLRTDGTSMLTLMRNVASSIGISIVIAQLTEGGRGASTRCCHEHVNPFNHAMQMPDVRGMIDMNTDNGRAMMDAMVSLQAQIIAFSQDYQMVMMFTLCAIPLAIMIGSTKAVAAQAIAGAGTGGDGDRRLRSPRACRIIGRA